MTDKFKKGDKVMIVRPHAVRGHYGVNKENFYKKFTVRYGPSLTTVLYRPDGNALRENAYYLSGDFYVLESMLDLIPNVGSRKGKGRWRVVKKDYSYFTYLSPAEVDEIKSKHPTLNKKSPGSMVASKESTYLRVR